MHIPGHILGYQRTANYVHELPPIYRHTYTHAQGTYSAIRGQQTTCTSCPPGSYTNTQGNSKCAKCDDVSFQNETGHSFCHDCPENTRRCQCESCTHVYTPHGMYMHVYTPHCFPHLVCMYVRMCCVHVRMYACRQIKIECTTLS